MTTVDSQERVKADGRDQPGSGKPVLKKIKILQLCAVDFTIYHFVLPLGRELRDSYDVHFASSPGPYVKKIRDEGFTFHDLLISRSFNVFLHFKSVVAIMRLLARERFDVVHTHTPIASLLGRFAAKLSRVPLVVYTAHGFYFHDRMKPFARKIFVALEKIGSLFTDHVFTVSAEDYDSAIALKIIRKERISFVGNGVDLERFNPDRLAGRRNPMRKKLGISESQPVICIVGRLVREKGYFELIRAVEIIRERVPDVRTIVVGGALESDYDDASGEIKQMVEGMGLEDYFRFLSFRFDVEELLAASDIFVLPSHREGMPVSILEAMAMGLPVVATNIRGSREVVENGATGFLVEVGDVEELARSITALLLDEKKRIAMGGRARENALRNFNERFIVKKQKDMISLLLRRKGFSS